MESLGHVLGSVDTKSGLPTTVSAAKTLWGIDTITTNDFAIVISDSTQGGASSRYEAIVSGSSISWVHAGNYSAAVPTAMANPYSLTMTVEGSNKIYNGSSAVSFTIPPNPTKLANPYSLTFSTGSPAASAITYDGSSAKSVVIPAKVTHLAEIPTLTRSYGFDKAGSIISMFPYTGTILNQTWDNNVWVPLVILAPSKDTIGLYGPYVADFVINWRSGTGAFFSGGIQYSQTGGNAGS
jgi:hypothetical protein